MSEDRVAREFDEAIKLSEERARFGKPSKEQIDFAMQQTVPSVRSEFISSFREKQKIALLKQDLQKFRSDVQRKWGLELSRPFLCATYLIKNMSDQFLDAARDVFKE